MRYRARIVLLVLALLLSGAPYAEASDVRLVDIARITWEGAAAPSASLVEVENAVENQVSPAWSNFTTTQGDSRNKAVSFVLGKTLANPIRINSKLVCDRTDFTVFMNAIRNEVYRQLSLSDWKERYLIILSPAAGCIWSGRAAIGTFSSKGGVLFLHNTASAYVITHELGHTLGLGHSNLLRCDGNSFDGAWSQSCRAIEYGGSVDVMGNVETSSSLSTYHLWRMGLLDKSEVKQSWLNETIELSASDVFGGVRAIFIRDGKSTYWIEYRRPKAGLQYKPGLVVYRTDPPPIAFIESPNPEDTLLNERSLAVSADLWMLNLDDYKYSSTGRANGSMTLPLSRSFTFFSGRISVVAKQSSSDSSVLVQVNRPIDNVAPPTPKLTSSATWNVDDSEILQPGYEDEDSVISSFELRIDGKIKIADSSVDRNYAPTYLDPLSGRRTIYAKELPEGSYSLSVRSTDVWGNTSQWSNPISVNVDRAFPIVTGDVEVTGLSAEKIRVSFTKTQDVGSRICLAQISDENGFVFQSTRSAVAPEFEFLKNSQTIANLRVYDCLGNGNIAQLYLKNSFIPASRAARTGKWLKSGISDGAMKCLGKCSISVSASGRLHVVMGQGKASATLVSSVSSTKTFTLDSINQSIRTGAQIDLGNKRQLLRITGRDFTIAGFASIDSLVSGQEFKKKSATAADASLKDEIQTRLSRFGFSAEDFTEDWTVTPLYRGTSLEDPTLDLCSATYESEKGRQFRRQVTVLKSNSPYVFLSTEVVKYLDEESATQAFMELKRNQEACVKNGGGVEREGTFIDYKFSPIPSYITKEVSNKSTLVVLSQIGKGVTARQLLAFYQFKGEMFTGLYVVKAGESPISDAEVKRWFDVAGVLAQRLDTKF